MAVNPDRLLINLRPDLYKELHPIKNIDEGIDISKLAVGSSLKVWWQCEKSHAWKTGVNTRHLRNSGCGVCYGKIVLPGFNDLASLFPHLTEEWHPRNLMSPEEYTGTSGQKVWWNCKKDNRHEWQAVISSRSKQNSGCPICLNQIVLPGINDLVTLRPDVAAEWNPRNTKPANIFAVSCGKKFWWKCKLGHEWEASIDHRTRGRGCPTCSNRIILPGFNDVATLLPDLVKEWSPKNQLGPESYGAGTPQKVLWVCYQGHEWGASIVNRKKGRGCPVCLNKTILIGFNDLASVCPELIPEWSLKNHKPITSYGAGSENKAWWVCSKGHEWKSMIYTRSKGAGCPSCSHAGSSKIEKLFHADLMYHIANLENGVTINVPWRRRKSMSIDMLGEYLGMPVIIEYDGSYFHSGKSRNEPIDLALDRDASKTLNILNAGYKIVRIREDKLPHLKINHENLFQVTYSYGDLTKKTIQKIMFWLDSFSEQDEKLTDS